LRQNDSIQNTFNDSQLRAIAHEDGPAIVIAGPGSGKTAVLVGRIRYLIEELHKNPAEIAVITFTRAAAEEMESRCRAMSGKGSALVTFGTFHSFFHSLIRMAGEKNPDLEAAHDLPILTEWEKRQIISDFLRRKAPELMYDEIIVSSCEEAVSGFRNSARQIIAEHLNECGSSGRLPFFRELLTWYEQEKKKRGRMDFEDILFRCENLLLHDSVLRENVQERFRYLMIDEFQDINEIQYRTISLIAGRYRNIFAVGDDDQAIYGFRGSDPGFMTGFAGKFPDACRYILSTNYRSGSAIVKASQRLISRNSSRIPKTIAAGRTESGRITYRIYHDPDTEAVRIAKAVRELSKEGISYGSIAVLGRTHLMVGAVLRCFQEYGIPCRRSGKEPGTLDHFVIRDIESYFRLTKPYQKRADFLRVMNRPFRNISQASFPDEESSWENLFQYYRVSREMTEVIREFRENIRILGRLPVDTGISYIRNVIGYEKYLQKYAHETDGNLQEWQRILDKTAAEARQYPNAAEWLSFTETSRTESRNENSVRIKRPDMTQKPGEKPEAVTVSTYHGVKGLEYHTVFLPSLNEGLVPDKKAVTPEEIEEERRLFYVAVTRASDCLHLSWTEERRGKQSAVSRFVEESADERNQ